jgi:hypothetical protein
MQPPDFSDAPDPVEDRREFLLGCGSLGRAEPPTTTLLASTTLSYFTFHCSAVAAGKRMEAGFDARSPLAKRTKPA